MERARLKKIYTLAAVISPAVRRGAQGYFGYAERKTDYIAHQCFKARGLLQDRVWWSDDAASCEFLNGSLYIEATHRFLFVIGQGRVNANFKFRQNHFKKQPE